MGHTTLAGPYPIAGFSQNKPEISRPVDPLSYESQDEKSRDSTAQRFVTGPPGCPNRSVLDGYNLLIDGLLSVSN
jgi:hypothetical protein